MSPVVIERGALYRRLQVARDAATTAAVRVRTLRESAAKSADDLAEILEWKWIELACRRESIDLRRALGIGPCVI